MLVAPSVFVTAGHCFVENAVVFVSTAPAFDPGTLVPGIVHVDPAFQPKPVNDLAVVTLFGTLPGPYAALPALGYDDTLPLNQRIENLGYGVQDPSGVGFFPVRMLGGGKIIPGGGATAAMFLKISSSPGFGSATCFGDSGGPNLQAGTNIVLAINSDGPSASCTAVSGKSRFSSDRSGREYHGRQPKGPPWNS